ncbi:MAG: nucleoside triphosphate pyrophosphohydrolase family protein [Dehalococcoidia bacterium]
MSQLPIKYEKFVRDGNFTADMRDSMFLAGLGLAGESGEVADIIKKHLLHGGHLDRAHLKEELGDVLWYLMHACNVFKIPISEVAHGNILKLCERYPNQYGDPADWYEIDEN